MVETVKLERGVRKTRQGQVVSKSGRKSIVVMTERRRVHPVYGKVIRETRKFHVHDESDEAQVGDMVRIVETRPLSRTKRWRLVERLGASKQTV
ncbi:MAG: 30S ribosomal protein S17 [Lentisphaerae bacterium RIFOXYC12_FULL_60_16]|nr:MAG: 30S ribosomal protein S17 [Lentisphaerae bacterium RIFOXYC12_FULL_60_16]OGV72562.1 MAG: 30S ribosomal protein S17 [Lentisphaerae bacterium RIFOXYA12_FULL_60_10]OGV77316.1 MAG: 30S ribosomal protein S17 [Lentisphaerae bacterium RIFOXYB12_FULL_60_10]